MINLLLLICAIMTCIGWGIHFYIDKVKNKVPISFSFKNKNLVKFNKQKSIFDYKIYPSILFVLTFVWFIL